MKKSEKELAFLREAAIENDWTQRFTDYLDKKNKFGKEEETFLYVNAGTGNHAIALREKVGDDAEIFAVCENQELQRIAQAKSDAVRADISFGTKFPANKSQIVLADLSLAKSADINRLIKKIVEASSDEVIFFLPTAGSFGEIFSFLWETLLETDLTEKGENVERLISSFPVIEDVEAAAKSAGLRKIEHSTATEIFEYKDGAEFVDSPLVADYLFPVWLDFLTAGEKRRVTAKVAELVDGEDGGLTFRFSVKNTLFAGKK